MPKKKKFSGCRMCGFVPPHKYNALEWMAHRLDDFDAHYPWKASRFVVKI